MSCTRVEHNWITQGYYGHFEDHYDIVLVVKDEETLYITCTSLAHKV
jgi:hypothetical protein